MSTDRETARIVRSWLDEGATELPDRVLDAVLDRLPATRQRWRRGIGGWFRLRNSFAVAAATAAAVVAVMFLVGVLAPPGEIRLGWSPDESAHAGAPPTPYPILPADIDSPLVPGRWAVPSNFSLALTLAVGPGWRSCWHGYQELGVCLGGEGDIDPPGVGFSIVDYVVADPCNPAAGGPPLGADADEVAAAISNLSGFQVTDPETVTIDGVPGLRLTVTAPAESGCSSLGTWATADRVNGVALAETNELTVLAVDATCC